VWSEGICQVGGGNVLKRHASRKKGQRGRLNRIPHPMSGAYSANHRSAVVRQLIEGHVTVSRAYFAMMNPLFRMPARIQRLIISSTTYLVGIACFLPQKDRRV
jgi:hypothetical protein